MSVVEALYSTNTPPQLQHLTLSAARCTRAQLDAWWLEARELGRDYYTHVAAMCLGIDYYDVMASERASVKVALFSHAYSDYIWLGDGRRYLGEPSKTGDTQ